MCASRRLLFYAVVRSVDHSFVSDVVLGGMRATRRYPCPPTVFRRGALRTFRKSLFHVSPISPGFLSRPLREAQPFPLEGILLPSTMDDFSDSDIGAPITYAQCELIPGSDAPMSLPVFSVPSGLASRLDQSSVQTLLALETSLSSGGGILCVRSSHGYGGQPVTGDGPSGLFVSRRTADSRLRMGIQRLACSFITHGSWSSSARRGRLASCTAHPRSG